MALPDSFMQELKFKTDITDIISTYVTLKKRGSTYVGLCPFHNEKTPSFTVYPATQSFYCFGCGAGGEAISFMRKIENLDYIDAVKALAQRAGIQMPDEGYDDSLAKKKRRILAINKETAKFFHSNLMSEQGRVGLNYFLNRNLSIKTIKHFGLGYAPDDWHALENHLKSKGFSLSEMAEAGVVKRGNKGYYDNFRNRVMTPIIDVRGNVIAFGGRVLDDSKPKYINTSDTIAYKKTNELFGLNFAKDSNTDSLILCEGYMDTISMHQAGFTNAVAGCGTALTNEQVRLISRYANEVVLIYDNDEAGQKALNKAISLFNQTDIKIRIPVLSGGKDPDEIINTQGKAKFKAMLEGASNEIEFSLINLRQKYNINTTQGKIDFVNEAIKILVNVTPVEQDLYISRLAEELGIEKQNIKLQFDNYKKRTQRRHENIKFTKIVDESIRETRKESYDLSATTKQIKAEERVLELLFLYPDCLKQCSDFDSERLTQGFTKTIFDLLKQKIQSQQDIDLIHFSQYLSDSEMAKLSKIVSDITKSNDPKKEITDCINTINNEFEISHQTSPSELSDDDYRNFFKNKKSNNT